MRPLPDLGATFAARARAHRRRRRRIIGLIVLATVAFCAADLALAEYTYGDWSCAFATCVKVKP